MNGDHIQDLLDQGENQRTEFKSEKVAAASVAKELTAFANTHGGVLLIGVEDDRSVSGVQRSDMDEWISNVARNNIVPGINPTVSVVKYESKNIAVVKIESGPHKPYQTIDGKYWIRVGSTNRTATKEELSRLFQRAGLFHYDTSPVTTSSQKDLDNDKLHSYWNSKYEIDYENLDEDEKKQLLSNADILVPLENELVVTTGGLLLFGKHPQRRLPHASIVFAVFAGNAITDNVVDKKEITGTLPEQIDNTAALVRLFTPISTGLVGMKRTENGAYPSEAVREALVNAVAHRDYSISNQKITVYLFDNRVEITSPGALANTLTIDKIKTGRSAPPNIFLVKYLDNMRYIDGLGRGIPRMVKLLGPNVRFEEIGVLFRVTIFKTDRAPGEDE